MKEHPFGSTGLRVSEFGLGCARIGGIFQQDGRGFLNLLAAARDAGINFFDTADMYSQGESEKLIGKAFRKNRHSIVIASKAGYVLPQQRRLAAKLKPFLRPLIKYLKIRRDKLPSGVRGQLAQEFSPTYLRKAVEGSLRRLRTDYIDILQLHSPPLEVVQRGAWEPALEAMKREGMIRYYGISCDTMDVGLEALRYPGVSAVQFPISLLEPGAAQELVPALHARKVGGIARESLANGLLVKEPGEIELGKYCHSPEQEAQRKKQLEDLRARAREGGVPLSRLALDYVSGLPGVDVTLIGVSRLQQLESLLAQLKSSPRPA